MIRRVLVTALLFAVFAPLSGRLAAQSSGDEPPAFDAKAAASVLTTFHDGLEGHSRRLLFSVFDTEKMADFESFRDQIDAYYTRYEAFRSTYHIIQVQQENGHGVALVDFQVESEPRGGGRTTRRAGQLRFEMEHGPKGWRIVDLTPRGFFS